MRDPKPQYKKGDDIYEHMRQVYLWECRENRDLLNSYLKHWYAKKGANDTRLPVDVYCKYCEAKRFFPLSVRNARRQWIRGREVQPCACRGQVRVKQAFRDILAPGWNLESVGSSNKHKAHLVCFRGHKRHITLDQARADAKKQPDGKLRCGRCLRKHGLVLTRKPRKRFASTLNVEA